VQPDTRTGCRVIAIEMLANLGFAEFAHQAAGVGGAWPNRIATPVSARLASFATCDFGTMPSPVLPESATG
jgi:hypothetical protein